MHEHTDEYTVGSLPARPHKGPKYLHFYILLALILAVGGAVGYLFVNLRNADADLRKQMGESTDQLSGAIEQQQKLLKAQLADLEVSLSETNKELGKLNTELGRIKAEIQAFKDDTQARFAPLEQKDLELAEAIKSEAATLAQKVDVVKAEFQQEQAGMKTVVAQIQDDSKYIVSELGKKAEKAYLRFMERKLKKQITDVSDKVDTVRGDLEEKIVATGARIEEVAGTVGETIKKKVEEHVKIDFVPSEMDEE